MTLAHLERFAALLCYGLAHGLWQATLVAALYWLVSRTCVLDPVGRHRLGTLGMLSLPLGLLLTLWHRAPAATTEMPFVAPGRTTALAAALRGPGGTEPGLTPSPWLGRGEIFIASAWMLVVCFLCIRGLVQMARERETLRRAMQLEPTWLSRCEDVATSAGAPARLRFVAMAGPYVVPYTLGVLRPVVVLPLAMLANLPTDCVEAIIRHEIGHVVRRHYLLNLLQISAEIVFFFHPAVWWLGREVRKERELCCDLDALAGGESPAGYARALLSLEELRAQPVPGLGALSSGLGPRIERIVSMKKAEVTGKMVPRGAMSSRRRAAVGWAASLVVAGLCAGGVAACSAALDDAGEQAEAETLHSRLAITWLPPDVKRHEQLINAEAARTGVDADALALMVLAESGGDPRAKSPAGALGLMQLMPATARAVSARSGIPLGNDEELYDPALNLKLGAELVKELSGHFAGRPMAERRRLVWSAYNAGSDAVARYLEQADVGLPEETERYVALLTELYLDKDSETSPRYDAWRRRVLARRLAASEAPADGARLLAGYAGGGAARVHTGADLVLSQGSSVKAVMPGTVLEAGDSPDGFGKRITLKHRSGLTTHYGHLGSIRVKVGDVVGQGDALGAGADAGPHGPHFHFEVRDQGALLDPGPFLRLTK
ncbi:MAG: transglycosylase SLT domain-containing protein [Myxococcales bacterium]|nr:transglycosylase SLT domain-containing protein [Myxococcales bacterium]